MYCKHCGHLLENGKCPECGWEQPAASAQPAAPAQSEAQSPVVDSAFQTPQSDNKPAQQAVPAAQPVTPMQPAQPAAPAVPAQPAAPAQPVTPAQPAFVAQNAQGQPVAPAQQPPMGARPGMAPAQPPMGARPGMAPGQPPMGARPGMAPQQPPQQPPQGGFPAQQPPQGGFPAQQPPQDTFPAQKPPMGGFPAQQPPMGARPGMPGQPPMGARPGVPGRPPVGPNQAAAAKKKKTIIIASIIAAVLIIGIIVAVLLLKGKDDDDEETTEVTTETTEVTTETTQATTENPDVEAGTRTIMVYIVGSNLESQGQAASRDIQEMLSSGFDESKVNVVIYTGGSYAWYTNNVDASHNCTLIIENGRLKLLEQDPVTNMGEADTLAGFINYAYDNFPAEQYDLILWNHGGGPFFGYGVDELSGDRLYLDELQDAFNKTPLNGSANKFDMIGFDACLMGNVEVAYGLAPYANYLVASEEPEPGAGWDYAFLRDAANCLDGAELGKSIVKNYMSTTVSNMTGYNYTRIGLSVIDLNRIDELINAIDDLFAVADSNLSPTNYSEYSRMVSNSVGVSPSSDDDESYDLIDLYSFANNLTALYPAEAQKVCDTINSIVLYNDCNEDNMFGITVYHPYRNKDYLDEYLSRYDGVSFSDTYKQYVEHYADLYTNPNTLTSTWDPASMIPYKNSDYTFSLQLDDAQAADISKVYFVVSRADTEQPGNYIFVAMGNEVEMSASNLLTADFDGQVRYMYNYTTNEACEIMYTEEESDGNRTRYLIPSILYNSDIQGDDAVYCYFVLETSRLNPEGTLIACYPMQNFIDSNGTDIYPSRYEINIFDFENVAFGNMSHEFTSTEDLTNFNDADWEDVVINYTPAKTTDEFSPYLDAMFDGIPYFGMFIIEDSQGNRHCSSLVQLK